MNLHRVARVACDRTAWLTGALFLLAASPLMAGPSFPEVGPDGKVVRYARMGSRKGVTSHAVLKLTGLAAGEHRIAVGDGSERTVEIPK